MTTTLDAVILGPIMLAFVSGWFMTMPFIFKEPEPEQARSTSRA